MVLAHKNYIKHFTRLGNVHILPAIVTVKFELNEKVKEFIETICTTGYKNNAL